MCRRRFKGYTVVNLYMCIYVHTDTEGLMED